MAKKVGTDRAKSKREYRAKSKLNVCPKHGSKVSTCALNYRWGCTLTA